MIPRKRICIETYGCSSNQMDSQIMHGLLSKEYSIVSRADIADMVIINTCAVKHTTESKERHRIIGMGKTGKKLVIAGCMPEATDIGNAAPQASMISTNHVMDIARVVKNAFDNEKTILLGKDKRPKTLLPKHDVNPAVRILEIQSGCNYSCNFCSTKLAKGASLSYPNRDIVKEAHMAIESGVKELWITGQEIAGYEDNVNLPQLVEKISALPGDFFIRLGMMHPASVLPIIDEMISIYKNEHVFKFLHMPMQSGSNSVLEKMKRKGSVEEFRTIVKKFRKEVPELTVWTDIIVGFPTETEKDFQLTLDLLKEIKPDYTNISQYSNRKFTKASALKQLRTETKKRRIREISLLVRKIHTEQNSKWLGWRGKAVVDEFNSMRNNFVARNISYKPIALNGNFKLGEMVDVEIAGARHTCLISRTA